jgi:uncharacterized protein YjiS (DUF1127 family)
MSAYIINRSVPLGSITTFRAVSAVERAAAAYKSWQDARATKAALNGLTGQQLADIGLTRGSIDAVARQLARA